MAKFDFSALYGQYPAVISQMPQVFDSHQFILELARQNQVEYVKALYAYLDPAAGEAPTPFQAVHGILAKKLSHLPHWVELIRPNKPSPDIFGTPSECAEWRRVSRAKNEALDISQPSLQIDW